MTLAPLVSPPKNETEERLLDCALTLFAKQGYEGTSVREIIELAGVTRPVLYYYCSSKEDLFKRLVRWKHHQAYALLHQRIAETVGCANRLREIITGSFSFCVSDPRLPRLMFQSHFGPTIPDISAFMRELAYNRFRLIERVIQEGLENREIAGGDAAFVALVFCSLMDQHINVLVQQPLPHEHLTVELAEALVHVFLYGVGTGVRPPNTPAS